jgi:hypothetical protein
MRGNMNKKETLRPFFQKHIWLLPIAGIVIFILSPILFPIAYIIEEWEDGCSCIFRVLYRYY